MKKFLYNPYVIAFIGLFIVILLWKSWTAITLFFKKIKAKNEVKQHGSEVGIVVINLQEVADEIYIAFHEYMFGTLEDEQRAINALIGAGAVNVAAVAVLYAAKGENLYTDFQKYLSADQYLTVKKLLI